MVDFGVCHRYVAARKEDAGKAQVAVLLFWGKKKPGGAGSAGGGGCEMTEIDEFG